MRVNFDDLQSLIEPLIDMPISHAWTGYGSTIFLELGALAKTDNKLHGEACISVEWDWRIENDQGILFGSSETGSKISRSTQSLVGMSIDLITIVGVPMEICVQLSSGMRLRTMAAASGDPQWDIRLPIGAHLYCREGALYADDGILPEMTEREVAALKHAQSTAERWGRSPASMQNSKCQRCKWFVWLDGNFDLHDYGVCTNASSPYDGRAKCVTDGCAEFTRMNSEVD